MESKRESVWDRIKNCEGEVFYTKSDLPFSYTIDGNGLVPSRTRYRIMRKDVERVAQLCPLPGPGVINNVVRGPAYIWGILHDSHIRNGQW